jgi:hypothetical protein
MLRLMGVRTSFAGGPGFVFTSRLCRRWSGRDDSGRFVGHWEAEFHFARQSPWLDKRAGCLGR